MHKAIVKYFIAATLMTLPALAFAGHCEESNTTKERIEKCNAEMREYGRKEDERRAQSKKNEEEYKRSMGKPSGNKGPTTGSAR